MKSTLIYTLALICTTFVMQGQVSPQWVRYASLSPDGNQIVFTYKGNLYTVAALGGEANQITFHEAHDYAASWSSDSKSIAFASDRYGNFDIFTMNALGGEATRLTYHSTNEIPYCFSSDDSDILFGAVRQDDVMHRQYPTGSQPELYSVSTKGGRVQQELTIPAEYCDLSKDGTKMLYHDRKGYENEWRKHHTSAITRDIWHYDRTTKEHKMVTSFEGEDRQPIFTDSEDAFYYLSEESGSFNVHKKGLKNGSKTIQLTNFTKHPVRFLSKGGNKLCFTWDGELYTMVEGATPKKVKVTLRTQAVTNAEKVLPVNGGVSEMDISPDGKEIAFITRGEVFVTSVDQSYTKRITNTPERERFVTFSADGKSVVYSREEKGKWSIYKTQKVNEEEPYFFISSLLKEEALLSETSDCYLANFSPDEKKMAYIEGRRSLVVMDLATKEKTTLLTPKELFHMRDGDKYFTWSPDSKWLLVSWSKSLSNSEVLLMKIDGSKTINLNESGYGDYAPMWVNDGKQMLWRSNRDGLKSYATSGRTQSDVYTMFFDQEAWDKFNLSEDDYKLEKELEKLKKEKQEKDKDKEEKKKKDEKKDKKEEVKDLTFDFDNMKEWKKRLTIHSSYLGDAVLSKDNEKLYYLARFEDKYNLWSTNLRTRETKMAMKLGISRGSLQWDKKRENLYLLSSGKISKIDPEKSKKEGVKISGEMDLDRDAERMAMFEHVWIRTNAIFYEPTFHGVDWNDMKTEYSKYLPHIGNSYEFAEMLSEMLGELNVSHAGARFSKGIPNGDQTASLGIFMDYDHQGNGIKIAEVIKGGPLDKSKYNLKVGDIITKIDGEDITPDRDVASYLNRKSGDFVLLEINSGGKLQSITMKPISIGAENRLLYKRWVTKNREEVEKKSGGKLGYVHIPGMSDGPYRNIYQDMMGKYSDADAVIIDARFNGGGDLVADLAMFFTGVPFITYATEAKVVGGEPTSRWTKPTLAMFNESMYSDGHCFACGYTDLKIGKTVGMPVPGTCSFAGWEGLPDGTRWGVVPISAKDINGKWMENSQTTPDIIVKNMPGKIDKGIDEQLEKAIEEMLK